MKIAIEAQRIFRVNKHGMDFVALEVIRELTVIPAKIKKILISNPKIAELSRIFTYAHNFLYLGRGYSFPVALEGALKLKEISYIHAEGCTSDRRLGLE